MAESTTISLYDDWRLRRDRLPADADDQAVQMQVQLLDYLLHRYHDDPEAQRPARFPLATAVVLNRRAIVVHHHLKTIRSGGTKNAAEVRNRISQVVDRMRNAATIGRPEREPLAPISEPGCSTATIAARTPIRTAIGRLKSCFRAVSRELRAMCNDVSINIPPTVRTKKYRSKFQQFSNPAFCDLWLLRGLIDDWRPQTKLYAFNAWSDRLREGCDDLVTEILFEIIELSSTDKELDRLRSLLADDHPNLRRAALELLAHCGTLDDVSLLCDLLALPWQPTDATDEREILTSTIQQIALRVTGKPIELAEQP